MAIPAVDVELVQQASLGLVTGLRVIFGLPGLQVGRCDDGERVGVTLGVFDPGSQFGQFDDRERQAVAATKHLKLKVVRSPTGLVVGQDRQAGDGAVITVVQAVVVGEHALGKAGIALALHFDVDVDPAFGASLEGHADQRIGKSFAQFGVAHHLAQFGVLELVALVPLDLGVYLREKIHHEFREGVLDDVFPRAVVVVGFGGCGHGEILRNCVVVVVGLAAGPGSSMR